MSDHFIIDERIQGLLDMMYAPMYTKILFAGIELDLFTELEEAVTYETVAQRLRLHGENTKHLMNALAGMGLLIKKNGYYKNSETASNYLVLGKEFYMGDFLRVYSGSSGFDKINLARLVEKGPDYVQEELKKTDASVASLTSGDRIEQLKAVQRGVRSREISDLIASLPEYPSFRKMLDLGGGVGLIGMSIVKKHHALKGVIFDMPEMADTTLELIRENQLEERMDVMAGNYIQDPIGEEYDLILAVATLNFARNDLDGILDKIYKALNPGGVFVCISDGLTHENTKPKEMTAAWLPCFLTGTDCGLRQGEVSDAALRNGFRSIYKRTVTMLTGPMDVDVARK